MSRNFLDRLGRFVLEPEAVIRRNLDRPWVWAKTFAAMGFFGGLYKGFVERDLGVAIVGALLAPVFGGIVGLMFGTAIWAVRGAGRRIGVPNIAVPRPDIWSPSLQCHDCGWHTSPDGPWPLKYLSMPPARCPDCGAGLSLFVPPCPRCGLIDPDIARWPRRFWTNWGRITCVECRTRFDRWGRPR